jgi:hypothetical protein
MGGLSMHGRRITGITGRDIVRRLLGIVRTGRISLVIDRHRIMVGGVRRIRVMVGGRLEMVVGLDRLVTATAGGIGRGMEMETGLDLRVMAVGLDRLGTAGILGMGEGLGPLAMEMEAGVDHRAMVVGLGRLEMGEVAGPQHLLLVRHQHHVLLPLLVPRLLRGLHRVVLLREDLIQGIRRVVGSRLNGLSRLVRGRVDLVGITMAQRRGRLVIAAKPALAAVGVREVNRNEIVQA